MSNSPPPDSSHDAYSANAAVTDLTAKATAGSAALSPPVRERSPGLLGWLGVLVFRAVVLVMGGTLAVAAGMAIATRYPAAVDQPPFLEKVLQGIESIR